MNVHRYACFGLAALLLSGLSATAQAQVRYSCRSPSGSFYFSTTPCGASGAAGSAPIYYGPAQAQPRPTQAPPDIGQAPDYITYMSPYCAGLHDAMRTANARGVDYRTQGEMRKNYARECSENEAEARNQWARERGEKKQMARSAEEAARRAQARTKQQEEQCGESKRILVTKRQRTDLTEGEKAELQRFETNYKARCT